jgi:hypothetical protein
MTSLASFCSGSGVNGASVSTNVLSVGLMLSPALPKTRFHTSVSHGQFVRYPRSNGRMYCSNDPFK